MKLNDSDIRNYITGALRFQADGTPVRMTESQDVKFSPYNPGFHGRCYNTAGIRIKFLTDGDSLSFNIETPGRYGVLMGDIPVFRDFYPPEDKDFPKHITVSLDKSGEKAVEFVFPNYQDGRFSNIEVQNASYIKKYEYKRKFLFYGDSITQGMSADRPFMNYASAVSHFFDAEILNQAISGSWFFPETIEKIPFDPDVVFIGYGTNELTYSDSIEDTDRRCKEYFEKIKEMYGDKKIIAISPLWRKVLSTQSAPFFEQIKECVKRHIKEQGIHLIDGYDLVPHDGEYFADQHLHPNNLGFSFYTLNLIKQIKDIIEE